MATGRFRSLIQTKNSRLVSIFNQNEKQNKKEKNETAGILSYRTDSFVVSLLIDNSSSDIMFENVSETTQGEKDDMQCELSMRSQGARECPHGGFKRTRWLCYQLLP